MTKDDKNVCFNSNRQKIQSDLSYNTTTEIGATDTTGLRTEYMLLYHIFTIKYILFTYVIQATISFTYQDCIS